jgi:tRNA threonylcarbamoyladenosine biosynthesis protein TsaB
MPDTPLILAVDTTSPYGSVALWRENETLAELQLQAMDGFAQTIFQAIEKVLAQTATKLSEIACFAAANGPGSFTGVRVGLTVVKGLAEATGKPAVGISNLRALSLFGHAPLRAVVLDARRGEVYGAVYDGEARLVQAETVSSWAAWVETIPQEAELIGLAEGPCLTEGLPFTVGSCWLAAAVARCAELDGPEGWRDPIGLDANYVRRSDRQLFWKDTEPAAP